MRHFRLKQTLSIEIDAVVYAYAYVRGLCFSSSVKFCLYSICKTEMVESSKRNQASL